MSFDSPHVAARVAPGRNATAGWLAVAAVGAVLVAAVIARLAIALGAPDDARQTELMGYAPLAVIGVLIGALGWSIVRSRSANPRALLTWLVPATLLVLFVPDLLLLGGTATLGTVLALMTMHLAIAAVALPCYLRAMPLPSAR